MAFDLRVAADLLPMMNGKEEVTKQLIDAIELYDSMLEPIGKKLLTSFVLKTRLSENAKIRLNSTYGTNAALINDLKCNFISKKSSAVLSVQLHNARQGERSVDEFGRFVENLLVDLTLAQANNNLDTAAILQTINEKIAINIFANGLKNRTLRTIIKARNYSKLSEAINGAREEESSLQDVSLSNKSTEIFAEHNGTEAYKKFYNRKNKANYYNRTKNVYNESFSNKSESAKISYFTYKNKKESYYRQIRPTISIVKVRVNKYLTNAIIDTGSEINLVSREMFPNIRANRYQSREYLITAGERKIPILGRVRFQLGLGNITTTCEAYVVQQIQHPILLGMDFLAKFTVSLNTWQGSISLSNRNRKTTLPLLNTYRNYNHERNSIKPTYNNYQIRSGGYQHQSAECKNKQTPHNSDVICGLMSVDSQFLQTREFQNRNLKSTTNNNATGRNFNKNKKFHSHSFNQNQNFDYYGHLNRRNRFNQNTAYKTNFNSKQRFNTKFVNKNTDDRQNANVIKNNSYQNEVSNCNEYNEFKDFENKLAKGQFPTSRQSSDDNDLEQVSENTDENNISEHFFGNNYVEYHDDDEQSELEAMTLGELAERVEADSAGINMAKTTKNNNKKVNKFEISQEMENQEIQDKSTKTNRGGIQKPNIYEVSADKATADKVIPVVYWVKRNDCKKLKKSRLIKDYYITLDTIDYKTIWEHLEDLREQIFIDKTPKFYLQKLNVTTRDFEESQLYSMLNFIFTDVEIMLFDKQDETNNDLNEDYVLDQFFENN